MNGQRLNVEIEPTNICNTVCLHCPHDAISRPYGKMDWSTYQKAVDQLDEFGFIVSFEFAGMGEPLLNPLVYQFIEYAHHKGATSLTTNASALTEQNIERLIEAGLGHLTISFNGDDPAVYELMMGGLNFNRAQTNLRNAVRMSLGTSMTVGANVSATRQTQDRLTDIKHYLNDAGISHIFFSKCHNRGGFLKGDLVCTTPPPPIEKNRCDIFTNTLFIAWSGDVLSCCHDLSGSTALGNLNSVPLKEILEKKQEIASHGVRFDICSNCNDLYRFMNDRPVDGRGIADWVYDLYSTQNQKDTAKTESLSEWLFNLYTLEGQQNRFFTNIAEQIESKEKQIQALEIARQQEVDAVKLQLDEVLNSRSWRTIKRLQQRRLQLIPKGSTREKWLFKMINLFTVNSNKDQG